MHSVYVACFQINVYYFLSCLSDWNHFLPLFKCISFNKCSNHVCVGCHILYMQITWWLNPYIIWFLTFQLPKDDAWVGGQQLCRCWEFPLIYLFSFFGADMFFYGSFHPLLNFVLGDLNYKCWMSDLKKQSLVSGLFSLHALVSYVSLMMPLGAMSRWFSKGCFPQTGCRWCVGPVLPGQGIKWCSSTPCCFVHLCRAGSGRTA